MYFFFTLMGYIQENFGCTKAGQKHDTLAENKKLQSAIKRQATVVFLEPYLRVRKGFVPFLYTTPTRSIFFFSLFHVLTSFYLILSHALSPPTHTSRAPAGHVMVVKVVYLTDPNLFLHNDLPVHYYHNYIIL